MDDFQYPDSLDYPQEWADCFLVLFYEQDSKRKVTYCKPIARAKTSEGKVLDFFGVRASTFGVAIPAHTTHWAICTLAVAEPKIVIQGPIPEEKKILEIDISETESIQFTRYVRNFKFSIGTKYDLRVKNRKTKTSTLVEEKFTIDESLELLFS